MADGKELRDNLEQSEEFLKQLREDAGELRNIFAELVEKLKQSGKSAGDLSAATKVAKSDAAALEKSAQKLAGINQNDLKNKDRAKKLADDANRVLSRQLAVQANIRALQQQRLNATDEERVLIDSLLEDLFSAEGVAQELLSNYEGLVQAAKELDEQGSFFEKAAESISTIPVFGPVIARSLRESKKELEEARKESDSFKRSLKQIDAVARPLGNAAFAFISASLFKSDTATTNLAKQLAITKSSARELKAAFNQIAIDSGTSALNANNLTEAFIELGNNIGAVSGFNAEQIEQQGRLTNLVGLQAGEASKLTELGILNNETTRSQTVDVLEQVKLLEQETGIRLEGRKILAEVANISGQLGAQYGYNTRELARAVVQSQRLGLSLEESKNIAGNLLDFESSIVNELNAELLLGRNLNLEQARLLALQGDSAAAAAELAKQFGSAEEFTSLNVIQQQSLADAMGMSVDQLADSIKKQQVLNSLGVESIKQLEEQGRLDELRGEANGEQLLQQYEQQSAAESFTNAVNKIQAAIGSIVEGPLGGLLDLMTKVADSAYAVYGALGLIAGVSLVRTIGSLVSMAASLGTSAALAITTSQALTLGLSAVAIAAGIGLVMAAMSGAKDTVGTMDDGIIPAGYGDTIVRKGKGTIALNNNDTVVAGTNLGQGSKAQERTNMLLEKLITQNDKKPQLSPVGLYEVQ